MVRFTRRLTTRRFTSASRRAVLISSTASLMLFSLIRVLLDMRRALRNMLSLTQPEKKSVAHHGEQLAIEQSLETNGITDQDWIPLVLPIIATTGDGIAELIRGISKHKEYLKSSGGWILKEQARLTNEVENLLQQGLHKRWNSSISLTEYDDVLDKVVRRQLSPRKAVDQLIKGAGL